MSSYQTDKKQFSKKNNSNKNKINSDQMLFSSNINLSYFTPNHLNNKNNDINLIPGNHSKDSLSSLDCKNLIGFNDNSSAYNKLVEKGSVKTLFNYEMNFDNNHTENQMEINNTTPFNSSETVNNYNIQNNNRNKKREKAESERIHTSQSYFLNNNNNKKVSQNSLSIGITGDTKDRTTDVTKLYLQNTRSYTRPVESRFLKSRYSNSNSDNSDMLNKNHLNIKVSNTNKTDLINSTIKGNERKIIIFNNEPAIMEEDDFDNTLDYENFCNDNLTNKQYSNNSSINNKKVLNNYNYNNMLKCESLSYNSNYNNISNSNNVHNSNMNYINNINNNVKNNNNITQLTQSNNNNLNNFTNANSNTGNVLLNPTNQFFNNNNVTKVNNLNNLNNNNVLLHQTPSNASYSYHNNNSFNYYNNRNYNTGIINNNNTNINMANSQNNNNSNNKINTNFQMNNIPFNNYNMLANSDVKSSSANSAHNYYPVKMMIPNYNVNNSNTNTNNSNNHITNSNMIRNFPNLNNQLIQINPINNCNIIYNTSSLAYNNNSNSLKAVHNNMNNNVFNQNINRGFITNVNNNINNPNIINSNRNSIKNNMENNNNAFFSNISKNMNNNQNSNNNVKSMNSKVNSENKSNLTTKKIDNDNNSNNDKFYNKYHSNKKHNVNNEMNSSNSITDALHNLDFKNSGAEKLSKDKLNYFSENSSTDSDFDLKSIKDKNDDDYISNLQKKLIQNILDDSEEKISNSKENKNFKNKENNFNEEEIFNCSFSSDSEKEKDNNNEDNDNDNNIISNNNNNKRTYLNITITLPSVLSKKEAYFYDSILTKEKESFISYIRTISGSKVILSILKPFISINNETSNNNDNNNNEVDTLFYKTLISIIYNKMLFNINSVISCKYSGYLLQAILPYIGKDIKRILNNKEFQYKFVFLCCGSYTNKVIQAIIFNVSNLDTEEEKIKSLIEFNIIFLSSNQYSNFVLNMILTKFSYPNKSFLMDFIESNLSDIVNHSKFGHYLLKYYIVFLISNEEGNEKEDENSNINENAFINVLSKNNNNSINKNTTSITELKILKKRKEYLLNLVCNKLNFLATHRFGHFVVIDMLEHWGVEYCNNLLILIIKNIEYYSKVIYGFAFIKRVFLKFSINKPFIKSFSIQVLNNFKDFNAALTFNLTRDIVKAAIACAEKKDLIHFTEKIQQNSSNIIYNSNNDKKINSDAESFIIKQENIVLLVHYIKTLRSKNLTRKERINEIFTNELNIYNKSNKS